MTRTHHRHGLRRGVAAAVALALAPAAGCIPDPTPPTPTPSGIELLSSDTEGAWRYEYFVNHDAPCLESGAQTFVVGTRAGSDPRAEAPLWTFMHGGGVGFYVDGRPIPNASNKTQESKQRLLGGLTGGLVDRVKASPLGFRMLAVSMCSHDTYAGNDTFDPGNDTRYGGLVGVPTTGLAHTLDAIRYVKGRYPTDDVVLHGGSAGSIGTFHVGTWMQLHGEAPTAIVADSAVVNTLWQGAQNGLGQTLPDGSINECYRSPESMAAIPARWDPLFRTGDDAHLRITSGQLTVPVMHVWSTNDTNQCGGRLMTCPLPDGSSVVIGSTQCNNRPIRDAIAALPPERASRDLQVCVDRPGAGHPEDCDWHVPTQTDGVNTAVPVGHPDRDYNGAILSWAEARVLATP